jgi:hypothetical protein
LNPRKQEKNIITERDKRNGKTHTTVSKLWPDGERFRRRCPNLTVARNLLARINAAIGSGTWRELRKELTEKPNRPMTMNELADIYYRDYCLVRNTRPDFKEHALKPIRAKLGRIGVEAFRRTHAHQFMTDLSKEVAPGTVNRSLAVLKNMLAFAIDKEIIDAHPLTHFRALPEDERALRIMELQEERLLVRTIFNYEAGIGAYAGI